MTLLDFDKGEMMKSCWTAACILLLFTLMFNVFILWLVNSDGGTFSADNRMETLLHVLKMQHDTKKTKKRVRERMRLGHRESQSGEEQTLSTLISFPLLPRNINNVAPKETDANRDKNVSSLSLGLCSSVLNQWQPEYTSKKTELWD